jgi:hypothetical protein
MGLHWSSEKSEELKLIRGLSFEEILQAELIGVTVHSSRANQMLIFFKFNDYIWVVPCVVGEEDVFLKTLFPSRKHTRLWRRGELT